MNKQLNYLSDYIVRLKRGYLNRQEYVDVPDTLLNLKISDILLKNGVLLFIKFEGKGIQKDNIRLGLKYRDDGLSLIQNIIQMNKAREKSNFQRKKLIKNIYTQKRCAFFIISTSKGYLTNYDIFLYPKYNNLSGKVLLSIKFTL